MATPAHNDLLKELLAASGNGDRQAFARLYQETSSKLFGVAIRIVRREDWAEEVVQESYVKIWDHAGNYRTQLSAPLTWMTSIVRNRCLDWLRRPNLEIAEDDDHPLDNFVGDGAGPLELLQQQTEAQALARCLGKLEAKMRQAIALAFFDGMSHSELAAHMREPLGTVKTWVRRGLERLKTCLDT